MQQIHRHGEIILNPITELPKNAKLLEKEKMIIIGHSESGHHHVLSVQNTVLSMYELEGKTYLHVPEEAALQHQKTGLEIHKTQFVAPGWYERIIKRAYSYAEKVMKRVID